MRVTNHIDELLGKRLRQARLFANLTQEGLANRVEISFQQIQKYENGTNRISASRIVAIARALDCDISYFYNNLPDSTSPVNPLHEGKEFHDRTLRTARIFEAIPEGEVKTQIYALIKSYAKETVQP